MTPASTLISPPSTAIPRANRPSARAADGDHSTTLSAQRKPALLAFRMECMPGTSCAIPCEGDRLESIWFWFRKSLLEADHSTGRLRGSIAGPGGDVPAGLFLRKDAW